MTTNNYKMFQHGSSFIIEKNALAGTFLRPSVETTPKGKLWQASKN